MAFVLDPAGVVVALWQANQHIGAALVNEPGTVVWNELITTGPGVVAFYANVLGLTTSTMDMGAGEYTLFEVDGQMVGGMTAPQMPGVPNHWHVYFAVGDADATVAKVAELGGAACLHLSTPRSAAWPWSATRRARCSALQPAPQPE